MEGRDYLNQISASVRPEKKSKLGFMNSMFFKLGVGAVIAFVVIMIIGMIISGGKAGAEDQAISLKLNIDNTLEVIAEYQPSVKSSDLRSNSASLYSVLTNTNRELTNFITEKYNYKPKDDDKKFAEKVSQERYELESALFEAKINGILDQVYASKIAYTILLISSKEDSLFNASSDQTLQTLLTTSYNSLETLYDQFNNFQK